MGHYQDPVISLVDSLDALGDKHLGGLLAEPFGLGILLGVVDGLASCLLPFFIERCLRISDGAIERSQNLQGATIVQYDGTGVMSDCLLPVRFWDAIERTFDFFRTSEPFRYSVGVFVDVQFFDEPAAKQDLIQCD